MNSSCRGIGMALLLVAASPGWASRMVSELHPADPRGVVQISSISGSLEVLGWDQPQVEVTGRLANEGDRVEISGDPAHLTVQVRLSREGGMFGGGSGGTRLTVHVPAASSVVTTLVSADYRTEGVSGDMELHTVSGDARGEVAGNLKASSVSGDIRLSAPSARTLAVKTVSGDIEVSGGTGDTDISTVSGSAHVTLGAQSHLHFKSTSGDMHLKLSLAHDADVEGEALSGDVSLLFPSMPAADFEVETHSGDIDNCFGPRPEDPAHGSGQRLMFRTGEGSARIRIVTHSGDVELCTDSNRHR